MTFFCDVIIRVSFKVLVPHLYVLEVRQSRMRLRQRVIFSCTRAVFIVFKYTVSPAENNSKNTFLKALF